MAISVSVNGQTYPMVTHSMVCFANVPNILELSSTTNSETFTTYTLTPDANWYDNVEESGQYTLSVDGDTIENIVGGDVVGKYFGIYADPIDTAFSIVNALRNCQGINASYTVYYDADNENVVIRARRGGNIAATIVNGCGGFLPVTETRGSTNNELSQCKVYLDFFEHDTDEYLTTAMKNVYGDSVAFNISPIIASEAEYGKLNRLTIMPYVLYPDGVAGSENTRYVYTAAGYKTTYSNNYLTNASNECTFAEAIERQGTPLELYLYDRYIPMTFINNRVGQTYEFQIQYLDATSGVISTTAETLEFTDMLFEHTFTLNETLLRQAFFVKVLVPNGYVMYKIIKPLKATTHNTRIQWRNEYGGISFFDFTGERSDSIEMERVTYELSTLNYYQRQIQNNLFEHQRIFATDYSQTFTVSSHLLSEAGTWIFESLAKSNYVWTNIAGGKYGVIIDSVSVEEQDVKGTYVATVEFHLSIEGI